MNLLNTLIWLFIYIEMIHSTKFVKCIDSTPTEKIKSNDDESSSSTESTVEEDEVFDNNIKSSPELRPSSPAPAPQTICTTIYNDSSLMEKITALEKFQIIDLLDTVVTKLKTFDSEYIFNNDLNKFVSTVFNKIPIILNIKELTQAENYVWKTSNNVVICTPFAGHGFKLVRHNKTVLWHTNNLNEYAGKIECDYTNNEITIYKFDKTKQHIKYIRPQNSNDLTDTYNQNNLTKNKLPITLNIYDLVNTDKYKWSIKNDVVTCVANDGYLFKLVQQFKNILWHTINLKNGSNKVECDYIKNKVTIYKVDGTKEEIQFTPELGRFGNLVTVDINDKQSTSLITYEKGKNFEIFTTVAPCLIRKIFNNSTLIWTCLDNMYPNSVLVSYKNSIKTSLTITFPSKTIEFYNFESEEENDSYDEDDNFDQLKINDDESVDEEDEDSINEEINKVNNLIKLKKLIKSNDEVEEEEEDVPLTDTKELQFITLNDDNTTSIIGIDKIKYENYGKNKCVNIYTFNNDIKCVKIKHEDKIVWSLNNSNEYNEKNTPKITHSQESSDISQTESSQVVSTDSNIQSTSTHSVVSEDGSGVNQDDEAESSENKYPYEVIYNTDIKIISVFFKDKFNTYIYLKEKWFLKITKKIFLGRFEISPNYTYSLKIYTFNDNDSLSENDSNKFEFKQMGKKVCILVFKLKNNSKCVLIEHRGVKIWSIDDSVTPLESSIEKYPLQISYHVEAKVVFVIFENVYLGYLLINNEWELKIKKTYNTNENNQSVLKMNKDKSEIHKSEGEEG